MRYISVVLSAIVMVSCSGNVDNSALPVLEVSDTEIDLAFETQAVFTVMYNGTDVTADAEILTTADSQELEGNVYTPKAEGTASFHAVYDGKESDIVTVSVIDTDMKAESRYDRHVFVAEFTGASCAFCPAGYDNMMMQFSKPSMSKYADNIHVAAFHSEEMGIDTLAIPVTMEIKRMFKGLDLPSYAVDMRDAGGLTSDGMSGFNAAVKASFEEHVSHCGVAVASAISEDGRTAEIQVKLTSELTSDYRVMLLIVQSGIVGYQKHGTYGELDDYTHNHVVRAVVSANAGRGEEITDDARVFAGQEVSKTWVVDVDSRWNLEKTEIYAIALDGDGYVNNMNVCHLDGGDSGYDMK